MSWRDTYLPKRKARIWMVVTLVFFVAAVVAFLTYDANRPLALDAAGDEAAGFSPVNQVAAERVVHG